MSTSYGELPDFLSAALKLSAEKNYTVLDKVDQGYHVQSDIRRKTQLHKTSLSYISMQNIVLADSNTFSIETKLYSWNEMNTS